MTAWADDDRGRVLADHLAKDGVELASDPDVLTRTATAAATIGADGAASYEFDLEWRIGEVAAGEPVVVHVCSLGAVLEPGAEQVLDLVNGLQGRATVSYDINARPAITGTGPDLVAKVERMVAVSRPGEGVRRGPGEPLPGPRPRRSRRTPAARSARRPWS